MRDFPKGPQGAVALSRRATEHDPPVHRSPEAAHDWSELMALAPASTARPRGGERAKTICFRPHFFPRPLTPRSPPRGRPPERRLVTPLDYSAFPDRGLFPVTVAPPSTARAPRRWRG